MDSSSLDVTSSSVLGGDAFFYQELICKSDDFSLFEGLVQELEYRPCWMSMGTPLWRPTAYGSEEIFVKSPTYERMVRCLSGRFGAEPIRSIVNFYRDGDDWTAPHSDQYFTGVNMTIGASFGEERDLVFENKATKELFSFPQRNGDIFTFGEAVNDHFVHSVPKAPTGDASDSRSSGRLSLVIWARRDEQTAVWQKEFATLPLRLLDNTHVLPYNPKAVAKGLARRGVPGVSVHPHFPDAPAISAPEGWSPEAVRSADFWESSTEAAGRLRRVDGATAAADEISSDVT